MPGTRAADRTTRRSAALAVLATAQFLVVLSTSIVNVALPSIDAGLALSPAQMSWVVNAYVLPFGALLLLGGRAADLLGRRRVFLAGALLFGGAALAAGLAPSAGVLIAARAAQGAGAAALAPAALALVMALYPAGRDRGRALAVWGAVSAAGGAAGVLLGGALTSVFGWPSIFFAVVPVAVAVVAATWLVVPRGKPAAGSGTADLPGALTSTAGLVVLVYAMAEAGRRGWADPRVLAALAAAAALLVAFVVIEHRSSGPLVPLRVFTTGSVGPAAFAMTVVGAVWVGLFFFLPLYQQQVLGYSPMLAGLTQLPLAGANITASAVAPRLARRLGPERTLTAGLASIAAGLLWLGQARVDGSFGVDILGPSLLLGAGLGTAFVQLTAAAVQDVPPADLGLASGLTNAARQVGGAIGLAALSAVAAARTGALAGAAAHPVALNAGYRAAFLSAAALILALILVRALPHRTKHPPLMTKEHNQ